MIRFSAGEAEIEAILRFLARRMPGGLLTTPLVARSRDDLRFRRTTRPLLNRLREKDHAMSWGLRFGAEEKTPVVVSRDASGRLQVDPEASRMIVLQLGPSRGTDRRRDGLLEARDFTDPPLSPEPRDTVERCARRIRRRSVFQEGRWHLIMGDRKNGAVG